MTADLPRPRAGAATKGGFAGYPQSAFTFLEGLAAHNEKAWFEANHAVYEASVKEPTAAFVTAVSEHLQAGGLPLEGAPKRSSFRIHRDVRFSRDKSPYKTSVGSVWYRQGSGKDGAGVLYFHLVPGGCFAAAAFYLPPPEVLGAIREGIRVHPERFLTAQAALASSGLALDSTESLSRMPRGFEDLAGSPVAAALKLKSFLVKQPVTDKLAQSRALVRTVADFATKALPLLQFGWAAFDDVRPGA